MDVSSLVRVDRGISTQGAPLRKAVLARCLARRRRAGLTGRFAADVGGPVPRRGRGRCAGGGGGRAVAGGGSLAGGGGPGGDTGGRRPRPSSRSQRRPP